VFAAKMAVKHAHLLRLAGHVVKTISYMGQPAFLVHLYAVAVLVENALDVKLGTIRVELHVHSVLLNAVLVSWAPGALTAKMDQLQ
jgi:hypothetical protein